MALQAPNAVEVNDFKFKQLRKLQIFPGPEIGKIAGLNLVATSSRFGLIFVGFSNGFKVLRLQHVLDVHRNSQQIRTYAEDYQCHTVLSSPPVMIALSADDLTLAVCVTMPDSRVMADMYDTRGFADLNDIPAPFTSVLLSSGSACLTDFMWNPSLVQMYAFCLSDGSVHIHEINDTTLKIAANLPPQTGASAVCWSPKGKQIVIGKKDGSFSQHKPTLQEVKNYPPPNQNQNFEVLNIHWLSTSVFAIVYSSRTSVETIPTLYLVSTPKGAGVSYIDYGDVCFSGSYDVPPRYLMHHESEWGVLLCSSTGSIETAVVGNTPVDKQWHQWIIDDSNRAELPLHNDKETYPLGMSVIYCSQENIVISDTEAYPPMPVLFLLSSSGVLCPFHVLNTLPNATSLIRLPELLTRVGERKGKDAAPRNMTITSSHSVMPSFITSTPLKSISENLPNANFASASVNSGYLGNAMFPNQPQSPISAVSQIKPVAQPLQTPPMSSSAFAAPHTPIFTPIATQNSAPGISPFQSLSTTAPKAPTVVSVKPTVNDINLLQGSTPPPNFAATQVQKRPQSPPKSYQDSPPKSPIVNKGFAPAPTGVQVTSKIPEEASVSEDAYLSVIFDEISSFQKELVDLKQRAASCRVTIGSDKQRTFLRQNTLTLTDFHKNMAKTMEGLNTDIQCLKTSTLECFSMIGDAESRNLRQSDPNYVSMLRERGLDPICAKRMRKISQLFHYLTIQIQELHDKLDHDNAELLMKNKERKRVAASLPSSDAIYHTVVNNRNVIHLLQSNINQLTQSFNRMNIKNASTIRHFTALAERNINSSLGMLADSLIPSKSQLTNDQSSNTAKVTPKVPKHIQSALRDVLLNRPVTCVRPTRIFKPSQSRLLSAAILGEVKAKEPKKCDVNVTKSAENSVELQRDTASANITTDIEASKPIPTTSVASSSPQHKISGIVNPGLSSATTAAEKTLPKISAATLPVYEEKSPSDTVFSTYSTSPAQGSLFTVSTPVPGGTFQFNEATQFSKPILQFVQNPDASDECTNYSMTNPVAETSASLPKVGYEDISPCISPGSTDYNQNVFAFEQYGENGDPSNVTMLYYDPTTRILSIQNSPDASRQALSSSNLLFKSDVMSENGQSLFLGKSTSDVRQETYALFSQPPVLTAITTSTVATSSLDTLTEQKSTTTSSSEIGSVKTVPILTSSTTSSLSAFSQTSTIPASSLFTPASIAPVSSSGSNLTATVTAKSRADAIPTSAPTSPFTSVKVTSPFGQTAAITTTASSVFGQPGSTTTTAGNVFGEPASATTTAGSVFVQATSVTTTASNVFGQPASTTTTAGSVFGQTASTTTTAGSAFGQATSTTTTASSVFGQPDSTTTTASNLFGQPASVTTTASGVFGQTAGTTAVSPSPFGQTSPFAQPTTPASPFGQTAEASGSPFGQTTSSFFSGSSTGGSVFGNASSGFSFGKSTFGQNASSSFGLAKAFGQSPTSPTSVFGQQPSETSVFGQSTFFGGLGGKPSEQNASKNVFGSVNASSPSASTGIFGSQGASTFGSKASGFSSGGFTTGGGSVAQSGFGAFQTSPQKSGFGAAPAFGGSPSFGAAPAFGSPPAFGSTSPPPFGASQPTSPFGSSQACSFSGFAAAADAPTFGSLASQQQPGSFNAMAGFGQQQQQPAAQSSFFPGGSSVFGGSATSAPSFGQTSSFASPSSGSGSSAFSQWRS